ncbi:MAG: hypothetical protein WCC22_00290 [Terriglobales bacterium]
MLRRLEGFVFFFAMILAVTLEGACVYWTFGHAHPCTMSDNSLNFVEDWTGLALPQGWLLGALLVLTYRVAAMFIPPKRWTDNEFLQHRRAFLRLWCWAMALVTMQGLALFFGRAAAAS